MLTALVGGRTTQGGAGQGATRCAPSRGIPQGPVEGRGRGLRAGAGPPQLGRARPRRADHAPSSPPQDTPPSACARPHAPPPPRLQAPPPPPRKPLQAPPSPPGPRAAAAGLGRAGQGRARSGRPPPHARPPPPPRNDWAAPRARGHAPPRAARTPWPGRARAGAPGKWSPRRRHFGAGREATPCPGHDTEDTVMGAGREPPPPLPEGAPGGEQQPPWLHYPESSTASAAAPITGLDHPFSLDAGLRGSSVPEVLCTWRSWVVSDTSISTSGEEQAAAKVAPAGDANNKGAQQSVTSPDLKLQ
ncbi:uncharacterized protein LOC141917215 [Strix aluco]|uniref:uncharacterized protein LOC141917215 n=1 Tax=Strix aluco TaxID=111821 RepID=UPI003DA27747